MSILHLKFVPHIAFFELPRNPQEGLDQIGEQIYPTNNPQLNQAVLPGLQNDRIGFRHVFGGLMIESNPIHYEFRPEDNLIHLWVKSEYPLTPKELAEELEMIDPNDGGPDGWMSGDISIVDESVAEQFGYGALELHPYISYVGAMVPDPNAPGKYVEYQVDLTKLPKV